MMRAKFEKRAVLSKREVAKFDVLWHLKVSGAFVV